MNTPEKIAQAYLRLNGFFTIPHFTILDEKGRHLDLLAVRLGGSVEKIGPQADQISLSIDENFLEKLGVNKDGTIGLIIEIKGGRNDSAEVKDSKFEYAKQFFGSLETIKKVGFENRRNLEVTVRGDHVILPLKYCMRFIKRRFSDIKSIEREFRVKRLLSKEGSWTWWEDFLADLLYLAKLESQDD